MSFVPFGFHCSVIFHYEICVFDRVPFKIQFKCGDKSLTIRLEEYRRFRSEIGRVHIAWSTDSAIAQSKEDLGEDFGAS